ncbi:MAG: patatin-like phospholipase family protein [Coriobacteriia bacterium]|nr:patatin-like phospholipase family protein [Coriobacteriia bacterium]
MGLFGPKRLGIALGSGSARGLAHVGVLKALEAAGIRPDVVTGTSMGAVVGAMYAAGMPLEEMEALATAYDVKGLISLADIAWQRGAIIQGEKIEEFLAEHLPERFEDLKIPFGCASTDLVTGHGVKHTSGDLRRAVRASISIPVVFAPVTGDGHVLVDGYLTEPVPVLLARRLGAEVVVAVEVCGSGTVVPDDGQRDAGVVRDLIAALRGEPRQRRRGTSALEVLSASSEILERHVALPALQQADVVISPDVHTYTGYDFLAAPDIIAAGERAGRTAARAIARKARLRVP